MSAQSGPGLSPATCHLAVMALAVPVTTEPESALSWAADHPDVVALVPALSPVVLLESFPVIIKK